MPVRGGHRSPSKFRTPHVILPRPLRATRIFWGSGGHIRDNIRFVVMCKNCLKLPTEAADSYFSQGIFQEAQRSTQCVCVDSWKPLESRGMKVRAATFTACHSHRDSMSDTTSHEPRSTSSTSWRAQLRSLVKK